jgi:hypothetical protein
VNTPKEIWTKDTNRLINEMNVKDFFLLFYYSYVHTRLGSFLPPAPTPSLTTHSAPSQERLLDGN